MSSVEKLHNYNNIFKLGKDWAKNHPTLKDAYVRFHPQNSLIEPLSHRLTISLILPTLMWAGKRFSPDLAHVMGKWSEPSIKDLREIIQLVEKRSPQYLAGTAVPLLLQDINSLLSLPEKVHSWIEALPEKSSKVAPKSLLGRAWAAIQSGGGQVKKGLFIVVEKITRFLAKYLPFTFTERIAKWCHAKIEAGEKIVYQKAKEAAVQLLKEKEAALTRKVVSIVKGNMERIAIAGLEQGTQSLVKLGLSYFVYRGSKELAAYALSGLPENVQRAASVANVMLGGYLCFRSISPTIHRLHKIYKIAASPEVTMIRELYHLSKTNDPVKMTEFVKKHL